VNNWVIAATISNPVLPRRIALQAVTLHKNAQDTGPRWVITIGHRVTLLLVGITVRCSRCRGCGRGGGLLGCRNLLEDFMQGL